MNVAAFLSYIFLTAFTPGPNNIMAMSTAGKHGLRKGSMFCTGVFFGFLFVMTCCAAGSALLYRFIPKIEPVMTYIGAAYILWLAWTIYRDKPHADEEGAETGTGANADAGTVKKSLKQRMNLSKNLIFSGMILQLVNVKVILYGISAMTTFILPYYTDLPIIALFILGLSAMGYAGTFCWALFGAIFEKVFSKHKKGLNIVMALLLVYCAASIIWGH